MRWLKGVRIITNEALNTHSNYFVVPNAIYSLGLSAGAIATYGYLSACENRNRNSSNRYTCHPSMATIGRVIGRDRKTVAKYVNELVEAGLILTEPTKVTTADGDRWNGNLRYTLLDPQRAVKLYHERQCARNDAKLEAGVRKKRKAMKKAEKKRQRKQKPHDEYVAERPTHAPEGLPF